MLNRLLDRVVNAYASFALRKYRTYPAAKTVILLVNVQRAFLARQQGLAPKLKRLLLLARENGFRVVHAPFGGHAQRYPSPAQIQLTQLLQAQPEGGEIPLELAPGSGDIVLDARATLSAFMKTDLHDQLRRAGIEHLVVAGPFANLALDSTVRDAAELGYHVTVVTDCISTESGSATKAVQVTMPRYAQTMIDLDKLETLI